MEDTPHWKRVWVAVSSKCRDVTPYAASRALDLTKEYLIKGLTMYKPYSEESYNSCVDKNEICRKNPEFKPFIRRMSMALNLDAGIAWAIFNNYVMFECSKTMDGIAQLLDYQSYQIDIVITIWQFYTLERTYLIRIMYHVLENHRNSKHAFHKEYNQFVTDLTYKRIQEGLLKQFQYLIKEISYDTAINCIELKAWVQRNNAEQLQVLLSILATMGYEHFGISEFMQILKIFKEHNFTQTPQHIEVITLTRPALLKSIKNAEIAIFICGLELFWKNHRVWYSHTDEINKMLQECSTSVNISAVLLAWVVLQTTLPDDMISDGYNQQLQEYLNTALEKNVFYHLKDVAGDSVFDIHCFASIVMRANIFILLENLNMKFGGDTVCELEGVVELYGELLRSSHLAHAWTVRTYVGLDTSYENAAALFPYRFEPFSIFAAALINVEKQTEPTVIRMCNLLSYTEASTDENEGLINAGKQTLHFTYKPFDNDLVVFPPGTEATVAKRCGQTVTTIHGRYSYFKVLVNMMNKFFIQVEQDNYDSQIKDVIIMGYKVLMEVMQVNYSLVQKNKDVKELLRLSHCMLYTTTKPRTKNMELMKFFFKVLITQLPHNPREVIEHLMDMKFLPHISKPDFTGQDFFNNSLLTDSTLLQCIQEELSKDGTCDLLLLYTKLVRVTMTLGIYHLEIQIPGLMFLILRVFPMMVNEFYSENVKDREVAIKLVKIVHVILSKGRNLPSEIEVLIFDCIIELFLNQAWYIQSIIKIFEIGNTRMELLLATEMNWIDGPVVKVVKTIKRALSSILIVLNFILAHSQIEKHRFLEEYLYQNYDISNLRFILGYVNHTFDPEIPKIACNILANFALVSTKPILQSLELDEYQVQRMFLERLRDPLVEDTVKVSIIYLIRACIREQTSMIAAFFSITSAGQSPDASIIIYIREFLKDLQENPNLLANPLQAGIVELLHGLWKMNKQHVIKELIDEENFWMTMISPMFKTTGVNINILLSILEILVLDIYSNKEKNSENFSKAIAKLFDGTNKFVHIWMNRLLSATERDIESSTNRASLMAFLTLWKKFILVIRHFYPEHYEKEWNKPLLEHKGLEVLLHYTQDSNELSLLTLWAELSLTFSIMPSLKSFSQKKETYECMVNVLSNFSHFYELVDYRCKAAVLTKACIILQNSEDYIIKHPLQATSFLTPYDRMFDLEYKNISGTWHNESDRQCEEFYYNWVLILRVLNTFLRLKIVGHCEYYFLNIIYLERISNVLKMVIKDSLPVRIAEVTAMSFIDYAESQLVKHFEKMYGNIIGNLILPNKYYLKENHLHAGVLPQHLKDWWTIFSYIIRLNGILLHRRDGYILKDILKFVITQHLVLIDGIQSATMVAESCNLRMVIDILRFLFDILKYMQLWTLEDEASFSYVMVTVKEVLNTAIGVILRPKILVFIPVNRENSTIARNTEVPEENLVEISNNFIEIATWACLCFSRINPPFVQLLDIFRPRNFRILVENDFRVPPVVNENPRILTYGSLLCALHFICKTLGQISIQEKEKVSESANVTPKSNSESDKLASDSAAKQRKQQSVELPSFNVFIYPSYTKETPETISALHRLIIPETTGLHTWLIRLDPNNLLLALTALNTVLAGQAFLTIHDPKVERSVMRYIRRELCSELLFFYDFVNKQVAERNPVSTPVSPGTSETRPMATSRKSKSSSKIPSSEAVRPSEGDEGYFLNVDISKICCDRSTSRTIITSVDDCYLLVLAHWFRHVCRLVHYSKFDEFLSQWHAKSTCVMPDSTYVKNTNFRLSDDEDDN